MRASRVVLAAMLVVAVPMSSAGQAEAKEKPSLASQSSHKPGFGAHDIGPDGRGKHARQRGPREGAPPSKELAVADRLARKAAGKPAVGPRGNGFPQVGSEVADFRTEFSKTFVTDNEGYVTRQYSSPVNFKGADGKMKAIDGRLKRTKDGFANGADRSAVDLPDRVQDRPVSVSVSGGKVSMKLLGGAAGAVAVDASTARYADVLPATSLLYEVLPGGLKESLELAGKDAPSSFAYRLELTDGLSAQMAKDDSVQITNKAGEEVFRIAAPTMHDSDGPVGTPGPVTAELTKTADGLEYRLRPDAKWLSAADRKFPVVVDPTVNAGGGQQCTITGPPYADYTGNCGRTDGFVGAYPVSTGYRIRSLQRYAVDSVPADSLVIGARLAINVTAQQNSTPVKVELRALTQRFTQGQASWQKRNSSDAWSTMGGDFSSVVSASPTLSGLGTKYFDITALTQAWVDGSMANDGLVLKTANEPAANDMTFAANGAPNSPYLEINYQPRFGARRGATRDTTQLTDRSSMSVDVANGNLMVQSSDLHVAGSGLDHQVTRTYNSLDPGYGAYGQSWVQGSARYPYISSAAGDSIYYVAADGAFYVFNRNPDTTKAPSGYDTPPGVDGTLCYFKSGPQCDVPAGMVATMSFRDGTTLFFGANSEVAYVTDQNGEKITNDYLPGKVAVDKITDTQQRQTSFSYAPASQTLNDQTIAGMTDAAGRTARYVPDAQGNLTRYTDATGAVTQYEYDANHDLQKITDPHGNTTAFAYDPQGRIGSVTRGGDTVTYGYYAPTDGFYEHPDGCPAQGGLPAFGQTRVKDARSNETVYCFDTADRVYATFDAYGHMRQNTYTSDDNVERFTAPSGAVFNAGHDDKDRPTGSTAPPSAPGQTPAQTKACYGDQSECSTGGAPAFLPVRLTDAQANPTVFGYDANDNLTRSSSAALNATVSIKRDGDGDLRTVDSVTDAKGHVTSYGYDAKRNLTRITPPVPLGATTIAIDAATSRPTSVTDGNQRRTDYTYDALDRVKSARYADGSSTSYGYDLNGNLVSRNDSQSGISSYGYDAKNRLISQDDPGPGSTSYGYDSADNLTLITDERGTVTYSFDALNRATSIDQPGEPAISTGYDVDDRPTSIEFPNGVVVANDYDAAGRLNFTRADRFGTALSRFDYSYRDGTHDRELRQSRTTKNGEKTSYQYDALNRLDVAETKDPAGSVVDARSYTLDATGNITKRTVNGAVTDYPVNDADQPTGPGYAYDGAGNQTSQPTPGGTSTLGYNTRNQTTSINPAGQPSIGPLGYLGSGQGEPTQIGPAGLLGSIPALRSNVLGISAQTTPAGTTNYTRDETGGLLSQRTPDAKHYYYLTDGQGSITALTDPSGDVVNTYNYDAYGQTTSSAETVPNSFGYAQGFNIGGLIHYNARYYNPTTARWTQPDPLDQTGDLRQGNRYAYTGGDPINFADPLGTVSCSTFGVGSACKAAKKVFKNKTFQQVGSRAVGCFAGARTTAPLGAGFPPYGPAAAGAFGCAVGLAGAGEGLRGVPGGTAPPGDD